MASAHKVVSAQFRTARHTGVTLEPRSILVDWNPAEGQMTAYHATQAPHMIQTVLATHLDLPESRVRVICLSAVSARYRSKRKGRLNTAP